MKRLTAAITFICYLSVSTAEANIIIACVQVCESASLREQPKSSCCTQTSIGCGIEMQVCIPVSTKTIALNNAVIIYPFNSISPLCFEKLSKPNLNAVVETGPKYSKERPPSPVTELSLDYEIPASRLTVDYVIPNNVHPDISTTVLRL